MTDKQKLRYELLKAANYSLTEAEKYYDFITKVEKVFNPNLELTDGIYLMYDKFPVAYKGQELSENEKKGCTGVGVKFGGKSMVVALEDISDDDIELTAKTGGTRFATNHHQAAEDMDGKANTDDIRSILKIGIADDRYIPSMGELHFMMAHFTQINAALDAVGGKPLQSDWYWSSTQYNEINAWSMNLNDCYMLYFSKLLNYSRIRTISHFPNTNI